MSMKNSNNTIGNRTRDLPACSAVPQPTAPRRAPFWYISDNKPAVSLKHFWCDVHSTKHTCFTHFDPTDGVVQSVRWYALFQAFAAGVNDIFAFLGCYAPLVGSWLPTFRNNLLVPFSKVKRPMSPETS
jgi:hypothetical protein